MPTMTESEYNRRQREAIFAVRHYLALLPGGALLRMREEMAPYLAFRREVSRFQREHFSDLCTSKCFSSRTSACCGREGIFTFFADVVTDLLVGGDGEADRLLEALDGDRGGTECVYLAKEGCVWALKPVVCEMFLCDHAREHVLGRDAALREHWEGLRSRERRFTYPDRPVLFDSLERVFLEAGCDSPLMYCHRSPGLLRLKARHGAG